ncbi:hypothetical protein HY633_01485 [Candidatus Uhrbacteria bacterium]|nr:hypothetical protein [Candidatus Uhrbacteria bacterium]
MKKFEQPPQPEPLESQREDYPPMHEQPRLSPEQEALLRGDLRALVLHMRSLLMMPENRRDYSFFATEQERRDLFEYCRAIAEYLKSEDVANLIVVDRSARPLYVGVREYWKTKYPDERQPNTYFMNPKGFKARENLNARDIEDINLDSIYKDDSVENPFGARPAADIFAELKEVYARLLKDKDKPMLVFDTCIHSGRSLDPLLKTLRTAGCEDVRVGAVNPTDPGCKVQTDFFITTDPPAKGCYPFDRDRIIEKTFDHVYSTPNADERKKEAAVQLRQEIQRIMREYLGTGNGK